MSGPVFAQRTAVDSLHVLNDNRITDSYAFTGNAATIAVHTPQYGYARATASSRTGNFKRPLEPAVSSVYGLSTGGSRKTGNWNLLAEFSYQKSYDKKLAWSAVNDPYRGNPFIWADSSRGDWDRDEVTATIGASLRLTKRVRAGLVVHYNTGTGARTSEPKPFYRSRDISLQPGVSYQLSPSEEIGVAGSAAFTQEENEIGYYSNSNVLLYRLRGYGTFSKSPFVSGERKRKGTSWKGTVHYLRRWKNYHLLVQANALQVDEEVFEGVARTQVTGYFTGINLGGKLRLSAGTAEKGRALEITAANKNGYADDMIFRAESASFIHHTLQAEWSCWKQHATGTLLQWSLIPSLRYVDYTDQASYMQLITTTVGGALQFNYRKPLNNYLKLGLKPAAGYYHGVENNFTSRSRNVIVEEMIYPDYLFFASHFWKAGCLLELEFKPRQSPLSHWITLAGEMQGAVNGPFSYRTIYQLQYSILF